MLDAKYQLAISLVFSTTAYWITKKVVPRFRDMFVRAHLVGVDQAKRDRKTM